MAFKADRADVSMLEAAGSTALVYINRLSRYVGGSLARGLNLGYAASQVYSKISVPSFLKMPSNVFTVRGSVEAIVIMVSLLSIFCML